MAQPSQQDIQAGVPGGANIVQRLAAPGGGEWLVGEDGGVFAIGGAPYLGSYQGLDAATKNDPNRKFKGIEATAGGGYKLISSTDEGYQFDKPAPVGPPPDTLTTDPGFLAFQRTSGLDLEYAAQDVGRKKAAIEAASTQYVSDTEKAGVKSRGNISQGFESRGISHSGVNVTAQQEQERAQAAQIAANRASTAGQIGDLQSGLAEKGLGILRSGAERGLSVGQTQSLEGDLARIRTKPEYRDYFAAGGK